MLTKNYLPNKERVSSLDFSSAILALKKGKKVARIGWDCENQYVLLRRRPQLRKHPKFGISTIKHTLKNLVVVLRLHLTALLKQHKILWQWAGHQIRAIYLLKIG